MEEVHLLGQLGSCHRESDDFSVRYPDVSATPQNDRNQEPYLFEWFGAIQFSCSTAFTLALQKSAASTSNLYVHAAFI